MLKVLLASPTARWAKWLIHKLSVERRNKKNSLRLHYMAVANECTFGNHNTINQNCRLTRVKLDSFSYVARDTRMRNVDIGKFCSIGPEVLAGSGNHPTKDFVSTHPIFYSERKQAQISFVEESRFAENAKTIIGNDVWIGARVIIADGVEIGDGAIVYAGSIVTGNVAPYSIVAGVPARTIRMRFSDHQIDQLLSSRWWDNDLKWLEGRVDEFQNVMTFLESNSD